jgi:hypothetical protein
MFAIDRPLLRQIQRDLEQRYFSVLTEGRNGSFRRTRKRNLPTAEAPVELDTPAYTLTEAATAADIKPGRLKSWTSRPPLVIPLGPHDQRPTKTARSRFTLRRVICIAVAAEFVKLGLSTRSAGANAFNFTDIPQADRPPCVEWPGPLFLIYYPQTQSFNVVGGNPTYNDALKGIERSRPGTVASFAVVSLAVVMQRVRERLAISVSKNG